MKSYALYAGCLISFRLPQFESSTIKTLRKIGIKIKQLDNLTCCPEPFSMKMVNSKAWYTIAARNICLAEEMGLDILTLCNGCNATLFRVNKDLKVLNELKVDVNDNLKIIGKEFKGKIDVKSILRVLNEELGSGRIRRHIKKPLFGIKVAVHYGCHIFDELKDYDDVKEPQSLKNLVHILGADVVSYPSEMWCCSAFARSIDEELSLSVIERKLSDLTKANADCLVVICPSCFLQFDVGQAILTQKYKRRFEIPVLYYTQLLGLAMGYDAHDLGLEFHRIKADNLTRLMSQN